MSKGEPYDKRHSLVHHRRLSRSASEFSLGKTKPTNLVLDIFAGSSGTFMTGLIFTIVFGMYNITLHYLGVPIMIASLIGALFWVELINPILT